MADASADIENSTAIEGQIESVQVIQSGGGEIHGFRLVKNGGIATGAGTSGEIGGFDGIRLFGAKSRAKSSGPQEPGERFHKSE
jgi:hypothetical protein